MRSLLLFIYCLFPVVCCSQIERYPQKVKFAIETYAFLKGQSAALQKVAFQFPDLQTEVQIAEKNSKVLFTRAEKNIEEFLAEELENSDLKILKKHIDSLLYKQLSNPIEKQEHALDFLRKVRERPDSITDTVLTKGILSFAYQHTPEQEIADGHFKVFTTQGHSKAKQTALKLSIPKSWLAQEAEMQQTIQQFTSFYGTGDEKFFVVIYDLPAEQHDLILDKKSILSIISPESKLIKAQKIKIAGRSGLMAEVEETLHSNAKIRMLQFMFIEKQKLYCLQGSVGPVPAHENLEPQLQKYEPLFSLIAEKTQIEN